MKTKRSQIWGIGILVLFIGTLFFFYWGQQKEVWFCDEIYTYESANGFEQGWAAEEVDTWMSGKDVEAFFAADWDRISLNDISVRLYNDHVPLYFWIFRMVSFFFFHGSGSIWIGLSMNLVFYLAVLLIVYGLFVKLLQRPVAAGVLTILTCVVNRLMLEQAMTLRMYMMLLWVQLLLMLVGLWILWGAARGKLSAGAYLSLFVLSVIGFLTHYDFWIYYAVTAFLFCLWLLFQGWCKRKGKFWKTIEFRSALAWVVNFGLALFLTTVLFPYCKWNLNRGKGQMALHSLFVFSREKLENILWGYERLSASILGEQLPMVIGLLLMFGCIIGGGILLYRKGEKEQVIGLTLAVLVSQAYQLIVCFTLPDAKEERYLWGVFTIMALCMAWGAWLLLQDGLRLIRQERTRTIAQWVLGAVLTGAILIGEWAVIDGGAGVAYLYHPDKDVELLEANRAIPWVVYGPTVGVYSYYDWLMAEQICFLTQEQTAEDAAAVQELSEDESFLLYTYIDYAPEAVEFFEQELGRELDYEYLTQSTNLTVYRVFDGVDGEQK